MTPPTTTWLDNRFGPNVRAEAVDIAEGADSVAMTGNTLDGTGTVSEYGFMNSLISVRGFGHQINDNVLSKGRPARHRDLRWIGHLPPESDCGLQRVELSGASRDQPGRWHRDDLLR